MNEVTKAEFREAFFRYGRGRDGWTQAYWERFYEADRTPPMRFRVEAPTSPERTRMMIVDDYAVREHRLFFMAEEAEERFFSPMGGEP